MNNSIITCNLCREKSLHLYTHNDFTSRQCINCGFTTNDKLKWNGRPDNKNEFFEQMSDFVKKYAEFSDGFIWIPSVLTLPTGSLYPIEEDNKLKWAFAKIVDVKEEEKENYPVEGEEGKFHTKKLDTENATIFDQYLIALANIQGKKIMEEDNG